MPTTRQARRCAAQHFGLWMIDPTWFSRAVAAVKAGTLKPRADDLDGDFDDGRPLSEILDDGIGLIALHGQMTKGVSSFGGVSSVQARQAVRAFTRDGEVKVILLHIDSPGGTVAGTAELAADVRTANAAKPVYAYIEDLGASAAYWVAAQAGRVSANVMGQIGSIGVLAILEDSSGMAEKEGIKVHVITSKNADGIKGLGVPGTPVTEDQLAYVQEEVDAMNEHFLQAIKAGRGLSLAAVRKLADGRLHQADEARELELIDAVESEDELYALIRKDIGPSTRARSARAARGRAAAVERLRLS